MPCCADVDAIFRLLELRRFNQPVKSRWLIIYRFSSCLRLNHATLKFTAFRRISRNQWQTTKRNEWRQLWFCLRDWNRIGTLYSIFYRINLIFIERASGVVLCCEIRLQFISSLSLAHTYQCDYTVNLDSQLLWLRRNKIIHTIRSYVTRIRERFTMIYNF